MKTWQIMIGLQVAVTVVSVIAILIYMSREEREDN